MAVKSSLTARRHLSLDLRAASKENEDILKVWATLNSKETNGASNIQTLVNTEQNNQPHKSHLYVRKKKKKAEPKDPPNDQASNSRLQHQSSEMRKTWLQKFVSWRYFMVLLLQTSFVVAMFLRNCLPMAMVCMVRPRTSLHRGSHWLSNRTSNHSAKESFSPHSFFNDTKGEDTNYEFDWNAEVQGLVLTSIMFSSFLGPLLVSIIKEKLGIKWTLTLSNALSTLLTFLSPSAARISPYCLVAVRLLLGICLGGNVPVVGDCVAWWAPQDEKLTMIALSFTGVNIGGILTSFLSGYLCLVPLDNGWPFVFYSFGCFSFLWGIFWHFLSAHKPENHPYISEKEKQYIIAHRIGMDTQPGKKVKPPYRKVLTSLPAIAFIATGTCHMWSTHVLFTYLPAFFNKRLKFPVQETGLLASLTSLFRMLGTFFWTAIGNKTTPSLGTNKSRKMCIVCGFGLAGITTIIVGFFDETYKWVVLSLLIFVMLNQSVGSATITAVPLDMAPKYAGLITGLFMSVGSFISISGPLLTAAITSHGTHEEWRTVWIIMGTTFITGAVVFLLFGHASLQPWAQGREAEAPNVVSPFVTMGRRFSTFIEAPPLSPISPTDKTFDYSQRPQSPVPNMLVQMAYPNPEVFYSANIEMQKINNAEKVEGNIDKDDSSTDDDDGGASLNDGYTIEENNDKQVNPTRKRAYSEFGLEVLRQKITPVENTTDLNLDRNPFFQHINNLQTYNTTFVMEPYDQIHMTGTENEAFEDSESATRAKSEEDHISHL